MTTSNSVALAAKVQAIADKRGNAINDPIAFLNSGLDQVVAGQDEAAIGTQKAAAGMLALCEKVSDDGVIGWEYTVDDITRRLNSGDLKSWFKTVKINGGEDEAGAAAIKALRDFVVGKDPMKAKSGDGAINPTDKTVRTSVKWEKRRAAFNAAINLAAKLAYDGRTSRDFTTSGFKVTKGDIAPMLTVEKAKHKATPLVGKADDQIILNPAAGTTFVVMSDGSIKAMRNVRHSVREYMGANMPAGKQRATGKVINGHAQWLLDNLSTTKVYEDDTMNKLNSLLTRLSAVINYNNAQKDKTAKKSKKVAAKVIKDKEEESKAA